MSDSERQSRDRPRRESGERPAPSLPQRYRLFAFLAIAAAVAARLVNAWRYPVLGGYDAFSHFAYVDLLAETWRVPLAYQGWSYFHPPLYYAWMALPWSLLGGLDPASRLRIGTAVVAALGCVHAAAAWSALRHRRDCDSASAAAGAAFPLLVPVMLYTAGFLGNEGLGAVLCSVSLMALLAVLARASANRAALLGLALGAALLTKFSAVVVAAAAAVAIGLRLVRGNFVGGARAALVAAVVAAAVAGPYYARNVAAFGDPFALARHHSFATAYVEANQPEARRGWADYLTFDLLIFRRPQWPRQATPFEDPGAHGLARSVRESVWTGLFASTWFDSAGGWVLPPVTESEASRRAGQILLVLALVPTGLVAFGFASALSRLRREGPDDTVVAFACATLLMLAAFVAATLEAPIAARVKASYLTPVVVPFAFWFALGLARLRATRPRLGRWAFGASGACGAASLLVFWQGLLFDPTTIESRIARYDDAKRVQLGVLYYAGGDAGRAAELFRLAARSSHHLAVENLGHLAAFEGRLGDALALLRRARRLQKTQLDGGPKRSDEFLRLALAEYDHSIAVVLAAMGRPLRADHAWSRALAADPEHGEARWSRAAARLERVLPGDARAAALEAAGDELARVRAADPGFAPGWSLAIAVEASRGRCDEAKRLADGYGALPWWIERRYPVEAGRGAGLEASIGRRQLPRLSSPALAPAAVAHACDLTLSPPLARSLFYPR